MRSELEAVLEAYRQAAFTSFHGMPAAGKPRTAFPAKTWSKNISLSFTNSSHGKPRPRRRVRGKLNRKARFESKAVVGRSLSAAHAVVPQVLRSTHKLTIGKAARSPLNCAARPSRGRIVICDP
jgi:hypothetical protein